MSFHSPATSKTVCSRVSRNTSLGLCLGGWDISNCKGKEKGLQDGDQRKGMETRLCLLHAFFKGKYILVFSQDFPAFSCSESGFF